METLERLLGSAIAARTAAIAAAIVVTWLAVRTLQRLATRSIAEPGTRYRARKAVGMLGYVAASLVLVSLFADDLGRLTIFLGAIGAGVAFALQEVIASFAGWLAVAAGGFYKVGDRVQLGGIRGDVIDIGPLRTTLMEVGEWVRGDLYNGRVVRVANSFVFREPVLNYSGDFPFLWDEIRVPVRFGSDLQIASGILRRAADEVCGAYGSEAERVWHDIQGRYPLEDTTTQPLVSMEFDSNWVTFTLRNVVRYDRRRTTRTELSERVLREVEASGGRVRVAIAAVEVIPGRPVEPGAPPVGPAPGPA